MQTLKQDLKLWDNKVFGNVGIRRINLSDFIQKQNFGHLSGRHFLKDLDSCDAIWLERQFTEEEVVQAFCGDKALGLDGFTIAFFNHCWVVVRVEVLATLQPFHECGVFKKELE